MIRRSQRKNIDTTKPMIILRPDSDARTIFDIKSDFEWEQFQSAMEEDHSGDWSDEDEDDNHGHGNIKLPFSSATVAGFEKAEVMTPSVKITTSFLQQSPRQQQQQHFDFDLNKKETPLKITPPFHNSGIINSSGNNMSSFATPVANPNPTHFNYHYYAFSSTPNANNIGGNQSPFVSQTALPSNSNSSSSYYYSNNNNPSFYDYHPYKAYSDTYFDYDLNQEDMNYYDSMKQKLLTSNTFENYLLQKEFLTCMNEIMNYRIFELLMIRLEKEMELISLFAQSRSQCEEHSSSLEALLEQSKAFVDNLNHFFTLTGKAANEKVISNASVIPSSSSSAATTTEDLTTLPTENNNNNNINNSGCCSKAENSSVDEKAVVKGEIASLQGLLDYYHSSQQQLQQKEQQQQSNSNNTNNNNGTSSRFSTDENDTPRTHASTTTPTVNNNNANDNCKESSFTKEELHKVFPKEQALKILLPIIYRFIIEKNSFRYLTNSLSSGNNSNNNNYNHSAMNNNNNNNRLPYKQKIGGEIEIDWNLLDSKYFQTIQSFCIEIHDYWAVLRVDQSSKSASFLRGFHNFIMPLWQRCTEANVPSIQEFGKDSFLSSHQQLHTIRDDLNRARTIVDRVRRREKLKKDLIKCSNENLLFNILYYNNSAAVLYQDQLASPAGALRTRSDSFLWSGPSQQNHHLSNTPKNFMITGKQQRSMSLLSEASGFLSNEGNHPLGIAAGGGGGSASNLLLPPRKRGRPRRVDPNALPIAVSSELVNDHMNSDGNNNNSSNNSGSLDPLQVAFIQGRDKFGKFLKKQPTVVVSALSHHHHYFQQQPQQHHQQYRDFPPNEESCYSNQPLPENNFQNAEEKDSSTELDDPQPQIKSANHSSTVAGLSIQNPSALRSDSDTQQQPLQIQVDRFSNNHPYYNSPNPNPQNYHHQQQYQKKRMEEELISKDRDISIRSIRFTLCSQDDEDDHDENDGYGLKDETEGSNHNKQLVKKTNNSNNSTAVSLKTNSNSNPNSHNTSGKSNKSDSLIIKKSPRIQNKKSAASVPPNNNNNAVSNNNKKTRPKQRRNNNNTQDHSCDVRESDKNNHKVEEEENENDNDSGTTISCNSAESLSLFSSSASSLLLSTSNNKTADLPSGL
jgi:hypothetical protein